MLKTNPDPPKGKNEEIHIVPPDSRKTIEWLAVLAAKGLDYRLSHESMKWVIHVPQSQSDTANAEISAYESDEQRRAECKTALPAPEHSVPASWSPLWVAGFITAFYLWLGPYDSGNLIIRRAVADSEAIRQGEWWRLITALTIHSGPAHLSGNLLSLLAFGWWACVMFGGGAAWLMILCAGVGGNAIACLSHPAQSISFGASTACFGALGIISACQMIKKIKHHGFSWSVWSRSWLPAGAGLAMLAMLGAGPGTDVTAHAAGFVCGFIIALPAEWAGISRLPDWLQRILQITCIIIVMSAWRAVWS